MPPRRLACLLAAWGAAHAAVGAAGTPLDARARAARRGRDDRADARVRERDARPPRAGRDAHRGVHLDVRPGSSSAIASAARRRARSSRRLARAGGRRSLGGGGVLAALLVRAAAARPLAAPAPARRPDAPAAAGAAGARPGRAANLLRRCCRRSSARFTVARDPQEARLHGAAARALPPRLAPPGAGHQRRGRQGDPEPVRRRRDPQPAEHVQRRRAVADRAVRARDHAVHHGVDHPAAADGRRALAREALQGGRGRPGSASRSTRATSPSASRSRSRSATSSCSARFAPSAGLSRSSRTSTRRTCS